MEMFEAQTIEAKWQLRWKENDTFRPDGPGKGTGRKFFMIFAYPGISGYLHVGHMRGFTYTDVMTRYKRAAGYDVLFPVGFHATGIPAISLAKRIQRKDPKTLDYMLRNGCPPEVLGKLSDVSVLIDFFRHVYIEEYWRRFGFGMDFSRAMTTVSPGYNRFITWQFRRLNDLGLLTTKPHYAPFCPNCGPVAVDSSMTDISQGGDAENLDFTVLKFRLEDGTVLPAATLRPETVYGVSNMWLNPNVEYVKASFSGETWLLSKEGAEKLKHQQEGKSEISLVGNILGKELIGSMCRTPLGRPIPILPGTFVDPNVATGVVMSVPAHAPFDWVALNDVKRDVETGNDQFGLDKEMVMGLTPITLIQTGKEYVEDPAGVLCRKMGIKDQGETVKLDDATSTIYKDEFHSGTLLPICEDYAGMKVSAAKEALRNDLISMGLADSFMEFSEPVFCRCGTPVIIRRIPDQWFIRYSDPEWTERSKEHAATMNIVPDEYARDMPSVLGWFGDRACIRQGSWLGTEFPFKKDWIIEPISDSTLYPTYYIVSKYLNEGSLKVEWMDDAFFDHVFRGKGRLEELPEERRAVVKKCREDFLYWYPLDINLGGKEHKTVHFPVFLMNHVALLGKAHWPRGIYVHWWVTMAGGDKISKTKGGAEPIPEAIMKYGVDAMRLYYCHVGSADMDVEWKEESVFHYRSRTRRVYEMSLELRGTEAPPSGPMDSWLLSVLKRDLAEASQYFEAGRLREASNLVYFTFPSEIRWAQKRGGVSKAVMDEVLSVWARMLQPITPHLAEELWETMGGEGFVSKAPWPSVDAFGSDERALQREQYIELLLGDLSSIKKMTGIEPKTMCLYTASGWKWTVLMEMLHMSVGGDGRLDQGAVIKSLMSKPELSEQKKNVPQLVGRLVKDVVKMGERERSRFQLLRDERELLRELSSFISSEMGCEVKVFGDDDPDRYDPMGKSKGALPLKPAIFME